jgi:hypothetical protein
VLVVLVDQQVAVMAALEMLRNLAQASLQPLVVTAATTVAVLLVVQVVAQETITLDLTEQLVKATLVALVNTVQVIQAVVAVVKVALVALAALLVVMVVLDTQKH